MYTVRALFLRVLLSLIRPSPISEFSLGLSMKDPMGRVTTGKLPNDRMDCRTAMVRWHRGDVRDILVRNKAIEGSHYTAASLEGYLFIRPAVKGSAVDQALTRQLGKTAGEKVCTFQQIWY
jgi:hypothetical protein